MKLMDALRRITDARRYLHEQRCRDKERFPCVGCPPVQGVAAALDVLDDKPRDARSARRALHDVVCLSGCGPESDHADRTQADTAALLRKFRAQEPA